MPQICHKSLLSNALDRNSPTELPAEFGNHVTRVASVASQRVKPSGRRPTLAPSHFSVAGPCTSEMRCKASNVPSARLCNAINPPALPGASCHHVKGYPDLDMLRHNPLCFLHLSSIWLELDV